MQVAGQGSAGYEPAACHDAEQQIEKGRPLFLGQLGERGGKNAFRDRAARPKDFPAGGSQPVFDPPASARAPADQPLGGDRVGASSKQPIALTPLDHHRTSSASPPPLLRPPPLPYPTHD